MPIKLINAFFALAISLASSMLSTSACAQFTLAPFAKAPLLAHDTLSTVVQTEQVRAELLVYAPDGVTAGKTFWLGLQLQHQPHWHTYWSNPGDSGLATQLHWTLPVGVTASEIAWPTPQKIFVGNLANFAYEGTVLLPVSLHLGRDFQAPPAAQTSQALKIELHAQWLVCRQECIPQEARFALDVPMQHKNTTHAQLFESARMAQAQTLPGRAQAQLDQQGNLVLRVTGLPSTWQGKAVNAFPETPAIIQSASAPSARDIVRSAGDAYPGAQSWNANEWSARIALSAQRSTSPQTLPWILSLGEQSVRSLARMHDSWPSTTVPSGVSPALQRALDANAAAPAKPSTGSIWLLLASALLGGLLLNLMPCVFPVLAIKVLGWSRAHAHGKAAQRTQGLAYTAGVVLSFMALGALMLALRAGGEQLGWGFQLQSPLVVSALSVLFSLLGLNMAGLLNIGHVLPHAWTSAQLRHPIADAFLSGALAVAIASPCTAPFMGAALGSAITLPAAPALGIFAALGFGLALPYMVLSWVPGIGRWLPRPGHWMLQLRHFMAFLMGASAVWLLWVLGQLSGVDAVASLLALLLALGFVIWSWGLRGRSRWFFAILSVATLLGLTYSLGHNIVQPSSAAVRQDRSGTAAQEVLWHAWSPARVQSALDAGKPVFVDFTAAWCITCQYNKISTLSNPEVLADFQQHQVTLLRADWTWRDASITQALQQLGRSGVPVYVLYQNSRAPLIFSEILNVADVRAALRHIASP